MSLTIEIRKIIDLIKVLKNPPVRKKTEWRAACRDTPKDKWEIYTFPTQEVRDQFITDCLSKWPKSIAVKHGD